jgi:uncharacterized membrane protein
VSEAPHDHEHPHPHDPAWRRRTKGEQRWPASLGVIAAVGLQATLPRHVALTPRWVLPVVAGALLLALMAANPGRIDRRSTVLRAGGLALIAVLSFANVLSAARLVADLAAGTSTGPATRLLLTGGSIWVGNVVAFALWYWELDRGGPAARAHAVTEYPDFLFAQMQTPELAPPDWEPAFIDYLYLSFTNATAFSPTDVLPLTRWAKSTMLVQSVVSLSIVVLVVARAINTLS